MNSFELKDFYQIRLSTAKGIHGVFYENVFYVMWLDNNPPHTRDFNRE